jgi:RNA polymerase primary sigma factor
MGLDTSSGKQGAPRADPDSLARAGSKAHSAPGDSSSPLALLVHDTLGLYLREMGREPLLSAEQAVSLARLIAAGRAAERRLNNGGFTDGKGPVLQQARQAGAAARARLVKANTRLVVSMGKKYRSLRFLDLIHEGDVGLEKAADRFGHRLGYRAAGRRSP